MKAFFKDNRGWVIAVLVLALLCAGAGYLLWPKGGNPPAQALMPAKGADLRDCASDSANITVTDTVGPLTVHGVNGNWAYVSDKNGGKGWIPVRAIVGDFKGEYPIMDSACAVKAGSTEPPVAVTEPPVSDSTVTLPDALTARWNGSGTACPYKDTGSSQPMNVAKQIKGLDGSKLYAVDFSKLAECAYVFEGRVPWQTKFADLDSALKQSQVVNTDGSAWDPWNLHMIIDLHSTLGTLNVAKLNALAKDVIPADYLGYFVFAEGSIWGYDPTWNMSDFKPVKPSIAEELEVKKFRDAMKHAGYNFPRIIMQPSGHMYVFWQKDSGDTAYQNGTSAGCTKSANPEQIQVYGQWDGSAFVAAIGAGNCKMAYWVDGSSTPVIWSGYQKDGTESVKYTNSVVAYMFPAGWTDAQVQSWIAAHPGGK